MTPIKTV